MEINKENIEEMSDKEEEDEIQARAKDENWADIKRLKKALEVHLLSLKKVWQKEKERRGN